MMSNENCLPEMWSKSFFLPDKQYCYCEHCKSEINPKDYYTKEYDVQNGQIKVTSDLIQQELAQHDFYYQEGAEYVRYVRAPAKTVHVKDEDKE